MSSSSMSLIQGIVAPTGAEITPKVATLADDNNNGVQLEDGGSMADTTMPIAGTSTMPMENAAQISNTNESSMKVEVIKCSLRQEPGTSTEISGVDDPAELDRCRALVERRNTLEDRLLERLDELKGVCVAEAELTGFLPIEVYQCLAPGEPEPRVKPRVGTTFKLSQELIQQAANADNRITQLQTEVELHRTFVAAAERLANDRGTNKNVRKKRRKDLQLAIQRLRTLERTLHRLQTDSMASLDSGCSSSLGGGLPSAGSGLSLNSLRNWSTLNRPLRSASSIAAKSCPSSPQEFRSRDLPQHKDSGVEQAEDEERCPSSVTFAGPTSSPTKKHSLSRMVVDFSSSSTSSAGSQSGALLNESSPKLLLMSRRTAALSAAKAAAAAGTTSSLGSTVSSSSTTSSTTSASLFSTSSACVDSAIGSGSVDGARSTVFSASASSKNSSFCSSGASIGAELNGQERAGGINGPLTFIFNPLGGVKMLHREQEHQHSSLATKKHFENTATTLSPPLFPKKKYQLQKQQRSTESSPTPAHHLQQGYPSQYQNQHQNCCWQNGIDSAHPQYIHPYPNQHRLVPKPNHLCRHHRGENSELNASLVDGDSPTNNAALSSSPVYVNIGYQSGAPQYRSAYRQQQFPTMLNGAAPTMATNRQQQQQRHQMLLLQRTASMPRSQQQPHHSASSSSCCDVPMSTSFSSLKGLNKQQPPHLNSSNSGNLHQRIPVPPPGKQKPQLRHHQKLPPPSKPLPSASSQQSKAPPSFVYPPWAAAMMTRTGSLDRRLLSSGSSGAAVPPPPNHSSPNRSTVFPTVRHTPPPVPPQNDQHQITFI